MEAMQIKQTILNWCKGFLKGNDMKTPPIYKINDALVPLDITNYKHLMDLPMSNHYEVSIKEDGADGNWIMIGLYSDYQRMLREIEKHRANYIGEDVIIEPIVGVMKQID